MDTFKEIATNDVLTLNFNQHKKTPTPVTRNHHAMGVGLYYQDFSLRSPQKKTAHTKCVEICRFLLEQYHNQTVGGELGGFEYAL